MKHWHRCQRWTRRGVTCPLRGEGEHEDTPDVDEDLQFTQTDPPTWGTAVLADPPVGSPTVGVREPRVPRPLARAAAAEVPIPEGPSPQIPQPFRTGDEGQTAITQEAEAVRTVMKGAEESVGQPAQRATFSEEDFDFLKHNRIELDQTFLGAGRLQYSERIQHQMAEEAAAEAFAPAIGTEMEVLRNLFENIPPGLVAIPVVGEFLRQAANAWKATRAPGAPRPGLIGRAGPVVPADIQGRTPITGSQGPIGKPVPSYVGGRPVTGGGMALQFNAVERMRALTNTSRRLVRPFNYAWSDL